MLYAGQRMFATLGPSRAVAMPDGRMYLVSHGKLHVFGPDGLRTESISLADLGVPVRPSDIGIHRDGRLLITDPDNSILHRCKLPRGPCETLDVGLRSVPGQEVLPLNAAKVYIDEEAKRYYVSDNFAHRVVIADFDGKGLAQSQRFILRYPNQLSIRRPGELSVVDTNNRRIVTFDVAKDRVGTILDNMDTDAAGVARPGREWPFDAIRMENGETFVLIARGHMKDADLVVFDADGKARRRIDLGEDSDPFDIEPWRGRIWVSDATNYRFESVTPAGVRGQIEDRAFLEELAQERETPRRWRHARTAAQAGVIVVPLAAIFALWRLGLVWKGSAPPPELGRQPRILIAIRMVLAAVTLVVLLVVTLVWLRLL